MSEDKLQIIKEKNQVWNYPDVNYLISKLEQCRAEHVRSKAEIKELEKRIDDWRGLCSVEQTAGMEWEEKAKKAEAYIEHLKEQIRHLRKV